MKVTIAVNGRFHAFYLANELQRHKCLRRLITTYPLSETVKYGLDRKNIKSLLVHELMKRAWGKLPGVVRSAHNSEFLSHELFDIHASRNIPEDTDIFEGIASTSLHSIRRSKPRGITTILDAGSSHMEFQRKILVEEYERYGMKPTVSHPKTVQRYEEALEEADYIHAPSRFVKATYLDQGFPAEKFLHVPFGVDLERFYPVPKRDKVFRVIHCGTLSLRKGVHYLLQAFSELNLPNAELWLVGNMTEEIQPFLTRFSSPAILPMGPFPEFELYEYYSQGTVFCLASIEEGLALVQPQAMACGLPVICTTNTGGEDIVRDGQDGFIVSIRDVEALKEKILFFYENREACKAMGYSAQQRVRSGFTWAHYGDKMVAEYRRILDTVGSSCE